MSSAGERAGYKSNGKGRSAEGKGKGDIKEVPADDRKGERKGGDKGERKGGGKGDKGGNRKGDAKGDKGKGKKEVKVVSTGLRGKVIKFVAGKPSGFIQRADGEKDVFFDLADVVEGEIEVEDFVEFDVVEGLDRKLYGSKVKKLPKDTDLKEEGQVLKSTTVHTASKAGSLTGGGLTLGKDSRPSRLATRLTAMAVQGQLDLKPGDRRALKASIAGMCGLLLWRMQLSCAPHPCFASSPSLRVSRSRPLSREHLAGTAHASSSHARLNCGRTLAAPAALLAGAGAGAAANSRRRRSFAGRKSAQADGEMARDPEAGAERVARDPEAPRSQAAEPSRGEGDDGLKGFVRKLKEDPEFQEDVKTFFTSLTVALLIRGFLVEPRFIPSLSMYPNFDIGDQLTVDKVSKRWREYQRRDVVVFNPPPAFSLVVGGDRSGDALIKRVVALAGDTVEIKNGGTLYINGEAQDEPFTNEAAKYAFGPITVPDGCVFVLGDNRNQSLDGHVWGPLPVENIIGRATLKFWPPWHVGSVVAAPP
ncbi:PLSP1 [Symbiodinium sp. KB8]|nr:PLSP1 [Symbiodinium sp. KB8]